MRCSLAGARSGLHDEHVPTANRVDNLDHHFAVAEPANHGLIETNLQVTRHALRERSIRVTGQQGHRRIGVVTTEKRAGPIPGKGTLSSLIAVSLARIRAN